jgi:ribosomal protein S27AE
MKCPYCHEDILQENPKRCPYCGNPVLIPWEEFSKSRMEERENLEKPEQLEDATQKYEELKIGKVGTINMECPHCGASQSLTSKSNEVTCKSCGKNYAIPQNVLDLL